MLGAGSQTRTKESPVELWQVLSGTGLDWSLDLSLPPTYPLLPSATFLPSFLYLLITISLPIEESAAAAAGFVTTLIKLTPDSQWRGERERESAHNRVMRASKQLHPARLITQHYNSTPTTSMFQLQPLPHLSSTFSALRCHRGNKLCNEIHPSRRFA